MGKITSPSPDHIRKKTAFVLCAIMFFTGFFAGIVLTVHKMMKNPQMLPAKSVTQPEQPEKTSGMAEAILEKIRENPGDANLWAGLGNLYFDSDMHEDAIKAYEKSLEIEPKNANVWTDLGVMYRRHGNPKKAVEAFDRAFAADSTHETSLFNKGVVLLHDQKLPEAAIEAWKKLIEINPLAMAPDGRTVEELIRLHSSEIAEPGKKTEAQ